MSKRLTGILGPVVTPFDDDEKVDLDAFAFNLKAHIEAGMTGVVVCGSTGEAALVEDAERARLLDVARMVVPTERWLLMGTGAESTRACAQRCRAAAPAGADAVLVVAPHYYTRSQMTDEALYAHYSRVADESPIPVLLYTIPKYMHFKLEPELIARLAKHPNIVGMKDSSGDMTFFERCVPIQSDSFTVLTGNGSTWSTALGLGASGGILAVALFAPELSLDVWRARETTREADADEAQKRLTPLAQDIVGRMGVAGVKAAMDRVGLRGGRVRSPLMPLPADDMKKVGELLRESSVETVAAG